MEKVISVMEFGITVDEKFFSTHEQVSNFYLSAIIFVKPLHICSFLKTGYVCLQGRGHNTKVCIVMNNVVSWDVALHPRRLHYS
jgi:hypothetical protein